MSTSQKLDYYPAQLYTGKRWYIGYYVMHPQKGTMQRITIKFNRIKNLADRKREGRQLVKRINEKLARGWNPLIEAQSPQGYAKLARVFAEFARNMERAHSENTMRADTLRSYHSYLKNWRTWHTEFAQAYAINFTKTLVNQFLDHIYFERNRTARTRNNYLAFLDILGNFMVEKEYLPSNPTQGIKKLPEKAKKRTIIPASYLELIFKHFKSTHKAYYIICLFEYLTFIRRTELTHLQLKHVNFTAKTILVPAAISKNKKDYCVTLPAVLLKLLIEHTKNRPEHYYLFGPQWLPARQRLNPKKISDTWAKMRKELKLPPQYQFYSLKDTGITQMLNAGIPANVVRDQARHHNISQTDAYVQRHVGANKAILDFWATLK